MTTWMTGGRLVTPGGVLAPGWLCIEGGRFIALGPGSPPSGDGDRHELDGRWVVPGFIDLHVHGGGGHSMLSADPTEIAAAAAFHRTHGTTRTLASIVSAPLDEMLDALVAVRETVRAGPTVDAHVVGSHLEGPFLNPLRAGAHDRNDLLPPDPSTFDRMLAAADGSLRLITVAPELPGGLDLVRRAVAAGVVVAIGHSDADHDQAMAAFDAGATHVTHLFNAMRPFGHRDPGLAGAALAHPVAVSELINDGVHLHDATAAVAFAAAGPRRIALVTDAIAAAGAEEGEYRLGSQVVHVADGAARLPDRITLAGSILTMDVALRRAVRELGVSIESAVEAASTTPSRVLGIAEQVGTLTVGQAADLVVLDDDLQVEAVMAAGAWGASGRLFHR